MSAIVTAGELAVALDQKIEAIVMNEYQRLNSNTWWPWVAKRRSSQTREERIHWLLNTAKIERPNASHGGGQAIFEELMSLYTEFENENAVAGLKLKKEQLEDLFNGIPGGEAMAIAAAWARDIGQYAAYWPQEVISDAIKANPTAYDGKPFFATDHPVNPFDTGAGTYANLFTGAASGSYPGALPIHNVDLKTAQENLAKARAYIGSIKMPNGKTPRRLRVAAIIVPPALMARAVELTSAKFLSGTNGPSDVEGVVRMLGLGTPVEAEELGANFGGSDTDYYLACEPIGSPELGAFNYVEREPFKVTTHSGMTSAELARKREFQWTCEGRNTVAPGHPYLLFKCSAE